MEPVTAVRVSEVTAMTVPLRRTGIPVLGRISWGAHICLFYETKQDLLDTHVAYFKIGLQDDEFCLWAISDPITEEEARDALARLHQLDAIFTIFGGLIATSA